ncbi:uncharacterized protein LOC127079728 [Lathyrus oleraceus]|uniref:uncharacterized protein LOC127079728 n=1 Tax=Pisum sativum TaxID=3888 RepID=UPI0021D2B730|nr:uncharacterized protein LOC127079728 [Pisum sativum]
MEKELKAIERNKTYEITEPPKEKKAINVIWVFNVKLNPDGSIRKHKTRLVARGFLLKFGLDYFEVFALVARHEIIILVIIIAANRNYSLIHLDVKSSFLNGSCSDEIMKFKKVMKNEFEMTYLGNMRFKLTNYKTAITPAAMNHKLDSDAEGDDVNATTFKQLVGSLRYLCNTRPGICYAVRMDLKIKVSKSVKLIIDNKSAISLVKNPVLHGRSKHIDTGFYFLK